jgi:hypothetical protein
MNSRVVTIGVNNQEKVDEITVSTTLITSLIWKIMHCNQHGRGGAAAIAAWSTPIIARFRDWRTTEELCLEIMQLITSSVGNQAIALVDI